MPTPWRRRLYKEIAKLKLDGEILDLGGSRKSGYHELIGGKHRITVANMDEGTGLDLRFDLESAFPIEDNRYDSVLAMNVLEHVFGYDSFLRESNRVLKPGGSIYIGVPFLMNIHPSPHDYWRYSAETLEKVLVKAGFRDVSIVRVGLGPFTASVQILSSVFRFAPLRALLELKAYLLDLIISISIRREVLKDRFPLGYMVKAKK